MLKKKLSKILCVLFGISIITCNMTGLNVKAATDYKFDFGGGKVESGYTGVSASTAYSKTLGYGFNTPSNMKNVTASGSGVGSDAVQFLTYGTKSSNTFNVDLPNGLYEVKVTLGDTARASVAAEGVFQIINMTGNNAVDKFQIPITDGQLNILVTEGKTGTAFTLSALEIKKLSDNPVTNRTIYIGGDSTVCNYYPLDTSVQAGWGQMLPKYVSSTYFQIRNMASSGQFARGFRDDGQFEAIMKYLKPGDYFILQLGINDTNSKNETTEAQFKEIMRDMVVKSKATGATVVLSTPQGRATDFNSSGVHNAENRWYRPSIVALAKEENVQLLDLNVLSSAYFTSIGPDATLALYMTGDSLHPNRAGATQLARIAYENLRLPLNTSSVTPTNTPTVKPSVSTNTPTITPTNTPVVTSTATLMVEDINGDNVVNMADVIMIARSFNAQVSDTNKRCDLNKDGVINMGDVILIALKFNAVATPTSTIYQAEEAYISLGTTESVNTGYTGSGYVNYDNVVGSYVEWTVYAPTAGTYSLSFIYSNGTTVNRPMEVMVNNNVAVSNLDFNSTETWTTWSNVGIKVNLNAGNNLVRATATTANGGPNIDYIDVVK